MIQDKKPLVSVIVPCYNYARFLPYTLDSILDQTYQNWECIIVDDGSKDNSKEVAGKYVTKDSRFRYIYQENAGLSSARNTGISKRGPSKYIQLLDADDLIHPDKIARQVNYLEANKDADLVYGDAVFFENNEQQDTSLGNIDRSKINRLKISGKGRPILRNLFVNNFIEVSCPLLRAEVITNHGNFRDAYRTYEDWHYWLRIACRGVSFAYDPRPDTVTYIRYGHSSMLGNAMNKVKYGIQLRRAFNSESKEVGMGLYNQFRLWKLYIKWALLKLKKS